jgi:predicted nucleic acid-binding Zn ribbon protein
MTRRVYFVRSYRYQMFECSNCGHKFECKLDVMWTTCPECGGRSYPA